MNNNKIEKMVDRLINVDQKDNILAQNLHKNFLVEHNLKENFKIMLNNEEKLLDKNKFGPAFKIVLEEIKTQTKEMDLNNLSYDNVNQLEELEEKCNNILKLSKEKKLEEVVKRLKEPLLTKTDINNRLNTDMAFQEVIGCLKDSKEVFNTLSKNELNESFKACGLNLKAINVEDKTHIQFGKENLYISFKDDDFNFSANKNISYEKLSIEQKEKYIMEAKLIKNILRDEINNGAPLSQEEITKRVNDSYKSYLNNYNKDVNVVFNDQVANSLVDKLKEQLLDTLSPDLKEQLKEHLSQNVEHLALK